MDFIKKHYEKVLIAVALLVLIGVATVLAVKVSNLDASLRGDPSLSRTKGPLVSQVPIGEYDKTLGSLQSPSTWKNTFDPFDTGDKRPPPPPTNNIVIDIKEPFALSRI